MHKPIPLIIPNLLDEDIENAVNVLRSGMLVQGEYVKKAEQILSGYTGSNYASLVSNGTASLHLALLALGIGKDDEVILPAYSFIATANVVEAVGAQCIFVDIKPDTFNIDETRIEEKITKKTKAIIPVHEFGLCANMTAIMEIANKYNLFVIEDAACAIGATFNNKHAGTFGHFGSFSFHPRKSVTSGEGGCLITNNPDFDKIIKTLRNHGIEPDSNPLNITAAGYNYRITDFQAALLVGQLNRLNNILSYKSKLASIYKSEIKHSSVTLPVEPENAKHTWQTFHIMVTNNTERNRLQKYLKEKNIFTNYGAQCIPATTFYRKKNQIDTEKVFPNAYRAYTCGLAIPLYEKLNKEDIRYISKIINQFR